MSRVSGPLVDLRKGEGLPALRAFLVLTLIIGGHTLLETVRDALFLGQLPARRLPIVYVIIAGLALVIAGPNARFVRRFGESRALLITLAGAAYGTVFFYLLRPSPTVVFAVYIWSAFLSTIIVVQFWMLLAQAFTPSQGKRLFGPIAAGGVTGAIAGAGGAVAALSIVPVRSLLLGAAGAFLVAALLSTTIGTAVAPGSLGERNDEPPSSEPEEPKRPITLVRRYPYLGWLAALTALSTAAVLGTDYLFKAEAARHVAPGALGSYFAYCYAAFNAAALVVQVVVTGPLVRRVGVTRALLVMPGLLLAGVVTVLVTGSPAAVLLTKGVDGAFRHSLHRVSMELLGLPIPGAIRVRVKPVLEGALTRAVQATMAGVILLLAAVDHGRQSELCLLIAALTLGWLLAAVMIRRPHLDMFRHAVMKGSLEAHRRLELDPGLVQVIVKAMSSPEPARALAAIELLVENKLERFIPAAALSHEAEEVQVRLLDIMKRLSRREWAPEAERLLAQSSEQVRVAAIRALASVGSTEALRKGARDESPTVRAYAVVALARIEPASGATMPVQIQEIADASGEAGRAGRMALLDAIRSSGDPRFASVLLAMLDSTDPELLERTVLAMASLRDPGFISIYLSHLHVRAVRTEVRDALATLGAPAQEALERAMRSTTTHPAVRLHIPRTLSRFGNQRAGDFLIEQLAIDPSGLVRYKVLRGLGRLVTSSDVRVDREATLEQMRRDLLKHLQLLALWLPLQDSPRTREGQSGRLVLGLLSDKLRQSLERAFRLLQIAYPREDIRRVYLAISSTDRRGRSNALEFLDALTSGAHGETARETVALLKLAADDLPPREKVRRAAQHIPDRPPSEEAALRILVALRDTALAALAAYHAEELGLTDLLVHVARLARDRPSLAAMTNEVLGDTSEETDTEDALEA